MGVKRMMFPTPARVRDGGEIARQAESKEGQKEGAGRICTNEFVR